VKRVPGAGGTEALYIKLGGLPTSRYWLRS